MKRLTLIGFGLLMALAPCQHGKAATPPSPVSQSDSNEWRLLRPLSLAEALDIALARNSAIIKSKADIEAAAGVVLQTRSIVLPRLNVNSQYSANEESGVDQFPVKSTQLGNAFANAFEFSNDRWAAEIKVVQSLYEGGRMQSAMRSAKLLREQALQSHRTVVANVVRDVRTAYFDALLAEQQISVQEASVKLLQQELDETKRRYDAGTVPRFNVLRAEVELANARPRLIRARNSSRISRDRLAHLLGETAPPEMEEIPLRLTDTLDVPAHDAHLSDALQRAFENRTELKTLRSAAALRREDIVNAKSGYKPSVQLFAGYMGKSSQFSSSLADELHGWEAGAQLNWNIFDGWLTRGRVREARALASRADEDITDTARQVELEVRTAWSSFTEAREVLESQKKALESAEESLRLATARAGAGSATQLDVLNAQTALTEARSIQAQARHDYAVAVAQLERATGQGIAAPTASPSLAE